MNDGRTTTMSGSDLLRMKLPPLKWVMPGVIPEGGAILAGRPKSGKSWLALQLAVGLATGCPPWGSVQCGEHGVLYIALEDGVRRLQNRVRKLWGDSWGSDLERLHFATEWPKLNEGCIDDIDKHLFAHPDTRLVVIDTLTRIRERRSAARQNSYEVDYDSVAGFADLGQKRGVGVLVVHHTRKPRDGEEEDPFDTISGTLGLTGATDTMLVMKRPQSSTDATLHVRGRDVEETSLTLSWDGEACRWNVHQGGGLPPELARVLLRVQAQEGTVLEIADRVGKHPEATRSMLRRLVDLGKLVKKGGVYQAVTSLTGSAHHDN